MIEAARASQSISRLVVDTDSPEIAEVARQWGAETPYLRPAEYARDDTPTIATLQNGLRWLEKLEGYVPDYLMCLQAVTPFLTTADIEGAVALALAKQAEAVVSVAPLKHPPQWLKQVTMTSACRITFPDGRSLPAVRTCPRRHELNGAIYLARPRLLLQHSNLVC